MGDQDTTATTTARLRLLYQVCLEPASSASIKRFGRGSRATEAPAPMDLDIIDYVHQSVREVVEFGRAANPDAGPAPSGPDAFAWLAAATEDLPLDRAQVRDAIVYRHALESAVRLGDERVIRREPCPACGCWSLFWRAELEEAACMLSICVTDGAPTVWTLAQLAEAAVEEKMRSRSAT